ncbi:glycosyltransferase family 2 protein [Dermabacteraceae bacterium P13115]
MTINRPLLSFVVPCYNSAGYMARCLDSLLTPDAAAGEIEVIVVDDGSADATPEVGADYVKRHPGIVRLVRQENGGHGAAVNTGIAHASGEYLKVVDSDDWLDATALRVLLRNIRNWCAAGEAPDVIVSHYCYENVARKKPRVVSYRRFIPRGKICTWDDLGNPGIGRYLVMHSLTYRLDVLCSSGLELPRHTFYVDNLVATVPLMHTRTLAYLDIDLYRYYIGREDQSVNEKVMISRMPQQLRVNRLMAEQLQVGEIASARLRSYILHYLSITTTISLMVALLSPEPDAPQQSKRLLADIAKVNPEAYRAFKRTPMALLFGLPGRLGSIVPRGLYLVLRRFVGFN